MVQSDPYLYSSFPKWFLAVLGVRRVKEHGGHGSSGLRMEVHSSQRFRELECALLESMAAVRQGTKTELCFLFTQGKSGLTCTLEATAKNVNAKQQRGKRIQQRRCSVPL